MIRTTSACSGFVWLGAVLLLLTLALGAAWGITEKLKSNAARVMLQREREAALAQANYELASLSAHLLATSRWESALSTQELSNLMQYHLTELRFAAIGYAQVEMTKKNGRAAVALTADLVKFPLLSNLPPAPLIMLTSLHPSASYSLFLPTTKRHPAYLLAVWSALPITPSPGHLACQVSAIDFDACLSNPMSPTSVNGLEVKDHDEQLPKDPGAYLFGQTDAMTGIKLLSKATYTNCDNLSALSSGLLWISGNCTIDSDSVIGSPDAPVLLIIENGHLHMKANSRIYGLVASFRHATSFSFAIIMDKTAAIVGALVLNHQVTSDSDIQIAYHYPVLKTLRATPELQQLSLASGLNSQ